jgi:hypothetical protein
VWKTYLFKFTIANGMPVGVLKAGNNLSAIIMAFSLNIWKGNENV